MFDVDNSGTIIVDEIHDSVQVRIQIDNNFIFIFYILHIFLVSLENP